MNDVKNVPRIDRHANQDPLAVSTTEAARLLGVSRPTIYNLIHQEGFPAFHVGARTLISVEGLRQWVNSRAKVEL